METERKHSRIEELISNAVKCVDAGLSILPVGQDKRPTTEWSRFQTAAMNPKECHDLLSRSGVFGFGVIGGAVSGNLEVLDIDDTDTANQYLEIVNLYLAGLPIVRTPRGGVHIYYRHEMKPKGNTKIAKDSDGKCLIETRGEGGYVVAPFSAPECHPLKKPYTLIAGSLFDIPVIDDDKRRILWMHAKSFNRLPDAKDVVKGPKQKTSAKPGCILPGDDFNKRGDWRAILEPAGWIYCRQDTHGDLWTRPGKSVGDGCSARTGMTPEDMMLVFSQNAHPFEADKWYSKFAAYTMLHCGADYSLAATRLAVRGYGSVSEESDEDISYELTSFADIKPEKIEWLWAHRIPLGKCTVLAGDGGTGKGAFVIDFIARLSRGEPLPVSGETWNVQSIILSTEDNKSDTLAPRLLAANANVSNVYNLNAQLIAKNAKLGVQINLRDHIHIIDTMLQKHPDVRVLVLDPVTAFTPPDFQENGINVRQYLTPICQLAERRGVTILAIKHYNKQSGPAKYKSSGSVEWINTPRMALGFSEDKGDESMKHLYVAKKNITKPAKTIGFQTVNSDYDPDVVAIKWIGENDLKPDDLTTQDKDKDKTTQAELWLKEELSSGAVDSQVLFDRGEAEGFSQRTLFRAKDRIGIIKARKAGYQGQWEWYLNGEISQDTEQEFATETYNFEPKSEWDF